jgi:enoyl-CoA hydratase/carnithine racemase
MNKQSAAYYEINNNIAEVYLNRPEQINAFNVQMRDDLYDIFSAIHVDTNLKGVIIFGNGNRGFCSGADLTEFGTTPSRVIAREARYLRDVWSLIRSLNIPTLSALHGFTIGSGLEMALCCDTRIASLNTEFKLPEVALAMLPFATGSQTLPRTIGRSRSLELLLTSRWFSATEALNIGIVNKIVEHQDLRTESFSELNKILEQPTGATILARKAIKRGADTTLINGLKIEKNLSQSHFLAILNQ